MARPSKLTVSQCGQAIDLRKEDPQKWSVPKLAKRFHVSESSMYKVFDGSYVAREDATSKKVSQIREVQPHKPVSAPMPSLFNRRASDRPTADLDLARLDLRTLPEPTELELQAAHLIIARSEFTKALRAA